MNPRNPVTPLTTGLAVVLLGVALMPLTGLVLGYALVFLGLSVALYVLYIACMKLIRVRHDLNRVQLILAYIVIAIGWVVDVVVNGLMSLFPFFDWPREWTLSDRVNRYRRDPYCHPRRRRLANWICANILVRYDPKHCAREVPLKRRP